MTNKKEEHQQIETIAEEEEESDGDDSVSDVESESGYQAGEVHPRNSYGIKPDDYLREYWFCIQGTHTI